MSVNPPRKLLAVSLADIGDLILTTPALRDLRSALPSAYIAILTTAHAAPVLDNTGLADRVFIFDKFVFDNPRALLSPHNLRKAAALAWELWGERFDTLVLFHHLTTRFGVLKYRLLALASGAKQRIGLDNGRGGFLTHRITDEGFGVRHQAEYWRALAAVAGAVRQGARQTEVGASDTDREWARAALPDGPTYAAFHPGSGGYSLARRWEPEKFARVANTFTQQRGHIAVVVGGPNDDVAAMIEGLDQPPVNLAGQTNLAKLAAVLERCTTYVGADSGVMHVASSRRSSGLAITALFGPSNHHAWAPYTGEGRDAPNIVRSGALCSPCSYVGHTVGLRQGCTARTCMKLIAPEMVDGRPSFALHPSPDDGSQRERLPALHILGIPIDALAFADLLTHIEGWVTEFRTARGRSMPIMPRMICTANPELVMMAQRDILFFLILNRCALVTADGVGLLWAARHLGHRLPARVTGSDGLPIIAERAAHEGWRVFLLGAAPGVAERAAEALRTRHPALIIVGTFSGSPAPDEEDSIAAMVATSGADILFLAYGSPAQEKWIARNLPRLNVAVVMGVGGALDFVAGVTQRAPTWARQAGLEWLHRLVRQPWRWRRMLRLPRFVMVVWRRGPRGPVAFVGRAGILPSESRTGTQQGE